MRIPARCVAIEDSSNGLRAAAAAGMAVIAVPNAHYPPDEEALSLAAECVNVVGEVTPWARRTGRSDPGRFDMTVVEVVDYATPPYSSWRRTQKTCSPSSSPASSGRAVQEAVVAHRRLEAARGRHVGPVGGAVRADVRAQAGTLRRVPVAASTPHASAFCSTAGGTLALEERLQLSSVCQEDQARG